MSLVRKIVYNRICDKCGSLLSDESWWFQDDVHQSEMFETGWKTVEGKDYCPTCIEVSEDGD